MAEFCSMTQHVLLKIVEIVCLQQHISACSVIKPAFANFIIAFSVRLVG